MAILQTCFCCSSLKQMALVAGVFSLIFSGIFMAEFVASHIFDPQTFEEVLHPTKNNLSNVAGHKMNADVNDVPSDGNNTKQSHDVTDHIVIQGSVINPRGFDALHMFYLKLMKLCCDILVLLSCIPLFIGLCKEQRPLLLPWIASNLVQVTTDFVIACYLLKLETTSFEPITAFIFTVHFLLLITQVYLILGVISLFQENFASAHQPTMIEIQQPLMRKQSAPPIIMRTIGEPSQANDDPGTGASTTLLVVEVHGQRRTKSLIAKFGPSSARARCGLNAKLEGASHDGGCTGERGKSTLEPVVEDEGSSNSNVANQEAMEKSEGECNTESTATASNSNNNNNCYNQDGQAKPIPPKLSAETDNVNSSSEASTHFSSNSSSCDDQNTHQSQVEDKTRRDSFKRKLHWPSARSVIKALAGANETEDSKINEEGYMDDIW